MGARRRSDRAAGMEAGERIFALWLGWLCRSEHSLCTWTRVAYPSPSGAQLYRMDRDLSVGKHLRLRVSQCRAAVHSPLFASLDRLRRHTRSLHAREEKRLFRKQPARNLHSTRICTTQSV